MDKQKNYTALKKLSQDLGLDLFGTADISKVKSNFRLSPGVLEKTNRAIALGKRLSCGILEEIEATPTRLYFHHYRTVNQFLDQAALAVSSFIEKKGFLTLPIPASQIVDWQNQKGHLSHKQIGYLSGLGWIGRNNLLVNEKFGSRFRLVSVLTNMPLAADKPVKQNCRKCRSCIEACPAQAIKQEPADFAHLACFEKLKEFQKQRLVDQYICGVCVRACQGTISP